MSGINKVILLGRLGKNPEVRTMPNGDSVANFSIATSEEWKDQQGQRQQRVEWHNCVAYRGLAEVIGKHLQKGAQVYIEGKLKTRKWQAQDGTNRYSTEIIIDKLEMLGGKQDDATVQKSTPKQDDGFDDDAPW